MPTVILPIRRTSGDYDPPAEYCYVHLTPEYCGELCDLIGLVCWLRARKTLGSLYALESFACPAVPFNTRRDPYWVEHRKHVIPTPESLDADPLKDPETGLTFAQIAWEDMGDYLVVPDGFDLRTDEDEIRTGTDTIVVTDDGVLFQFTCRHSAGEGETNSLSYYQLAQWAGRLALDEPWRQFSWDPDRCRPFVEAHPIPLFDPKDLP